jgi:hypothetical protein
MRAICCVAGILGGCGFAASTQDSAIESNPTNQGQSQPLLCAQCSPLAIGGDTTDFGGEPPLCTRSVSTCSEDDAASGGYPADDFLSVAEGTFSTEIAWSHLQSSTTSLLSLTVKRTDSYICVQRQPTGNASPDACPELLEVGLEVTVDSNDNTISGRLSGYAALERAEVGRDLTFTIVDGQGQLRGHLPLEYGGEEYEQPEALVVESTLSVRAEDRNRACLRILVKAGYDLDSDPGFRVVALGESPAECGAD